MEIEKRIQAYRFVAYASTAFAAVGVLVLVTTMPMMFNFIGHMRMTMRSEAIMCRVSLLLNLTVLMKLF